MKRTALSNRLTSFPIAASTSRGDCRTSFRRTNSTPTSGSMKRKCPYTHPPEAPYNWVRVRLLGGRSLFWARQSFRLSDLEFKAAEIDGTGDNWPISLADLAPFYSRVEQIFRVIGPQGRLAAVSRWRLRRNQLPPDTDSIKRFTEIANKRGSGFPSGVPRSAKMGLASSINLLLPDALATGKLDIVENAIVREISVDKNTGLANGAHFLDRHSGREMHVKTRAVVLAAGCLESTRLLLNSKIAIRAA